MVSVVFQRAGYRVDKNAFCCLACNLVFQRLALRALFFVNRFAGEI